MSHPFWTGWYLGWGWFLSIGISVLFFSTVGNWGYSYLADRRFGHGPGTDANIIDLGRLAILQWENEGGAMAEMQLIGPPKSGFGRPA